MILTRFVLPFEGNKGFIGIDAGGLLKPNIVYGIRDIGGTLLLEELGYNSIPVTESANCTLTQLHFDGRNFLTDLELGSSNNE